ncbi:MAG: ribosomal protein S18-alanine N-acetyltransferase [Gemmatimonadetes bacterium]|nr:ribosomal protein S18-alanine N-acetyltransferase [Gemmatimonadota bacterium]
MDRVAPSSAVVARRMVMDDVPRVASIEAEAFTSPWKADTFATLLQRPGAELWVLDDPEVGVVAYAVVWCILDQGELANIAVASSHRGRGLGRRLLGLVLDAARDRGVKSIYLEVRSTNIRAADLYRAFGFERIGVRRDYYDNPIEDAILMVARL